MTEEMLWWESGSIDAATALVLQESLCAWAMADPLRMIKQTQWAVMPDSWERACLMASQFPRSLGGAATVLWDPSIVQAAFAGQESFVGGEMKPLLCPQRAQLWFLRGTQLWPEAQSYFAVPDNAECDMVLVEHVAGVKGERLKEAIRGTAAGFINADCMTGREGLRITLIWSPLFADPAAGVGSEWFPSFRALPSLYVGDKIPAAYAGIVAGLSFLALPFVGMEPALTISRQQRRARERKNRPVPDVRTVILRRVSHDEEETAPDPATEKGAREYHCRWLVGAHWRRRSERWKKGEGPIFVSPHLKGPADQEFRPPRKTVFEARR